MVTGRNIAYCGELPWKSRHSIWQSGLRRPSRNTDFPPTPTRSLLDSAPRAPQIDASQSPAAHLNGTNRFALGDDFPPLATAAKMRRIANLGTPHSARLTSPIDGAQVNSLRPSPGPSLIRFSRYTMLC